MDRLPSVITSWCLFAVLFFTAQTAFSEAEPSVGLLDFASQPRLSAPTLSPTGRYLAARVNVRERQLLMIREVDDLKKTAVSNFWFKLDAWPLSMGFSH